MADIYSTNILITGTSSGLGKELALYLASLQYNVFVTLRNNSQFSIYQDIKNITCIGMDVCKEENIENAAKYILEKTHNKGISVLINNAGVVASGPLEYLNIDEIKHQFDVNILGVLLTTKKMLPQLKKNNGKIINIGSMSCRMAIPFIGAYGASKSALKQLSWSLRIELKAFGVSVHHFELGNFASEIWNKSQTEDFKEYSIYMEKIRKMMVSRKNSFNNIDILLQKMQTTIEGKNKRFNTIIGKDAKLRRIITSITPNPLLEKKLLYTLGIK